MGDMNSGLSEINIKTHDTERFRSQKLTCFIPETLNRNVKINVNQQRNNV